MRILGLFIELRGHGGVQRLGRHMAAVLDEFCGEHSMPLEIVSFADPVGVHEQEIMGRRLTWRGCGRRAGAAVFAIQSARPVAACIGHPFIAPFVLPRRLTSPGFRYMVHVHGIEMWSPMNLLRRHALRGARLVSATSRHSAGEAVRHQGIRPERTRVLYPALDPVFEHGPVEVANLPEPFILSVARLGRSDALKHIDLAIHSFARLAGKFPQWNYVIVGDGDDRPRLEAIAASHGLAGRVRFLGRVSDDLLAQAYRQCEFFVLPSVKEGLGIVFLEAMRSGKPLIGARAGGTPEVVRDGETGFAVDPSGSELTERMLGLMESSTLRQKIGESGRAVFNREFSSATFRARLVQILLELTTMAG